MTLYCVLREYNFNDAELSNDYTSISHRAAECKNGTNAKLQYEDVLSIYDLLYGMMLPSGNDAAIALAEHVGKRILRRDGNQNPSDIESYNIFIDLMNKNAKKLHMKNTHFSNPHGMRNDNNLSTASDLMKLGLHCQLFPLFNTIVSTK